MATRKPLLNWRRTSTRFVAHGMVDAVIGALSQEPPVVLKLAKRRTRRPRPAPRKVSAARPRLEPFVVRSLVRL